MSLLISNCCVEHNILVAVLRMKTKDMMFCGIWNSVMVILELESVDFVGWGHKLIKGKSSKIVGSISKLVVIIRVSNC